MMTRDIRLITISREFGAGGSDLGQALGARLGWPVLDRDIVHRVAERLRMDDTVVEHLDEHPPSLLARIATVLIIPQPDIYAFPPAPDVPSHDAIAAATTRVITEASALPPLIVVGHGAQCIFGGRADTLHVRVIAPAADRIRRVCARMHVDPAFAANLLRRADQDREAYVQRHFHRDWRNDLLYDVQVNTSRVSIDEAVLMLDRLIESRSSIVAGADPGSGAPTVATERP